MKLTTIVATGLLSSSLLLLENAAKVNAFSLANNSPLLRTSLTSTSITTHSTSTSKRTAATDTTSTRLYAIKEKGTIQILMSDTGGGHRASANALRDAFDELYPGQIEVDIVDIVTDYGSFFPINAFVTLYKIMAEYPILWEITYKSGATPFGLWFNELVLEVRH